MDDPGITAKLDQVPGWVKEITMATANHDRTLRQMGMKDEFAAQIAAQFQYHYFSVVNSMAEMTMKKGMPKPEEKTLAQLWAESFKKGPDGTDS